MAKLTQSAKQVRGRKMLTVKVKNAKYNSVSSNRWLQRQLNDPYVAEAKRVGYRSRAAFKLIQLDEKYHFLGKGKRIVDLGCAPGGWTQIAAMRNKGSGEIVGMDLLPTEPIEGAILLQQDFTAPEASDMIKTLLHGPANVVMSDMAANTTGVQNIDHLRSMGLVEIAYEFAKEILAEGGIFIAKVFQGGTESSLLNDMKQNFTKVTHYKPDASRQDSVEMYVVAQGFKGKSGGYSEF
jgi:23S rRNA (uridine2552-2'-O)-methyltransferase